jgi:poly-gamma-glutamate synthesis protein (capsule biosynthesis protein)
VESTAASVTETTAPPTTVIHLAAAGDLNVTERVVASGVDYNYNSVLLDVGHLLADADITTVNLEGTLTGDPFGVDRSAPQGLMDSLVRAGVDMVQLANSYSIHKGMDGLKRTISGVRQAGLEPLGVYTTTIEAKEAKGYTLRTVQGVKIAFVAFTKGMDGMALPPGNEGCVNVLYTDYSTDYQQVDEEGISRVLDAAAKEKPDLIVALVHWGSEFNNTISESQKKICALMQERGVAAIIGTHSHYVQKMEFDPEKGTFVAYSLGDFLGDADRAGSEYSVILNLEITKDNQTGQTAVTGYEYFPIFTVAEEEKPLKVLRIREAMAAYEGGYLDKVSQPTYDAMAYALGRIEARIKGE